MVGEAADITAYDYPSVTNEMMAEWLYDNQNDFPLGQVITYDDTTHLHVSLQNENNDKEFLVHRTDDTYDPWRP